MRGLSQGLLVLVMLIGLQGAGIAQGGLGELPPGKWWQNRLAIQQLRLTPEQQQKIEGLWIEDRKALIDQKAELDKLQLDLHGIINQEIIDESAALQVFDAVQRARMELERSTFLMRIRIKNTLTPEQQRKLEVLSDRLRAERAVRPAVAPRNAPRRPPAGQPPPLMR